MFFRAFSGFETWFKELYNDDDKKLIQPPKAPAPKRKKIPELTKFSFLVSTRIPSLDDAAEKQYRLSLMLGNLEQFNPKGFTVMKFIFYVYPDISDKALFDTQKRICFLLKKKMAFLFSDKAIAKLNPGQRDVLCDVLARLPISMSEKSESQLLQHMLGFRR